MEREVDDYQNIMSTSQQQQHSSHTSHSNSSGSQQQQHQHQQQLDQQLSSSSSHTHPQASPGGSHTDIHSSSLPMSHSSTTSSRSIAPAHIWNPSWHRSSNMYDQPTAAASSSSTSSSSEWSSFLGNSNHSRPPADLNYRQLPYSSGSDGPTPAYAMGGLPSSMSHTPWQASSSSLHPPVSGPSSQSQYGHQGMPYYSFSTRPMAPPSSHQRPSGLSDRYQSDTTPYIPVPPSHNPRWRYGGMDLSLSPGGEKLAPSFHQAAQASLSAAAEAASAAAAAAAAAAASGSSSSPQFKAEDLMAPPGVGPSYRIYDPEEKKSQQLIIASGSAPQEEPGSPSLRGAPPPVDSDHWYDPESPVLQAEPPASDFQASDPKMVPTRNEKLRSSDDRYTPTWVRGSGKSREAWCDKCPQGGWFKLKVSAYWFHVLYRHGVSQVTGQRFEGPVQTRTSTGKLQRVEGLCRHCNRWITTSTSRSENNWVGWFKHSHACHPTSRRVSPEAPTREGDSGPSAPLVYAATDPRVYGGIPYHMAPSGSMQPSGSVAPSMEHHSPMLHTSYPRYRSDGSRDDDAGSEQPSKRHRSS